MLLYRLLHPLYLLALTLLLLNDHYWKATYANALTGKLSDVVGLFAFAWFWACILPRYQRWTWSATALIFIWWKTPFADSFIKWANNWGWPLTRTVDYTDYWALLILPVAWWFFQYPTQHTWRLRPIYPVIILLSLGSFVATSVHRIAVMRYPEGDVRLEKTKRIKHSPKATLDIISKGDWPINKIEVYNNPKSPLLSGDSIFADSVIYIQLPHLYRIDSLRLVTDEWLHNIHFQLLPIRDGKQTKLQWINVSRSYQTDLQNWRDLKALQEYYELRLETDWLDPLLQAAKQ